MIASPTWHVRAATPLTTREREPRVPRVASVEILAPGILVPIRCHAVWRRARFLSEARFSYAHVPEPALCYGRRDRPVNGARKETCISKAADERFEIPDGRATFKRGSPQLGHHVAVRQQRAPRIRCFEILDLDTRALSEKNLHHLTCRKQFLSSLTKRSGCSKAAKWPPLSSSVQWIRRGVQRSAQLRGAR